MKELIGTNGYSYNPFLLVDLIAFEKSEGKVRMYQIRKRIDEIQARRMEEHKTVQEANPEHNNHG